MALGKKELVAEQSKWEAFARAMGLVLNPLDQEGNDRAAPELDLVTTTPK
jgi:hypothetical protein